MRILKHGRFHPWWRKVQHWIAHRLDRNEGSVRIYTARCGRMMVRFECANCSINTHVQPVYLKRIAEPEERDPTLDADWWKEDA